MRYTADNGKESPGTDKPVTPLIVPALLAPTAATIHNPPRPPDVLVTGNWTLRQLDHDNFIECSPDNSLEDIIRGRLLIRRIDAKYISQNKDLDRKGP